jgi:uncharacterized damage-inducible protein DinB
MVGLDALRRLFEHLSWADARVVDALAASSSPPEPALELLAHVLGAEEVWLARLEGRDARLAVWPELGVEACRAWVQTHRAAFEHYLGTLVPADLREPVAYRNSAGIAFTSTREDILFQVALHGAYHRGQVALLLRQGGARPEPTDYIAFTRGAPAATRQSRPS